MPNHWHDVYALISMWPKQPFESLRSFLRVFSDQEGQWVAHKAPSPTQLDRLIGFLSGVVVARPIAILKLPPKTEQDAIFTLNILDWEFVVYYTSKYYMEIIKAKIANVAHVTADTPDSKQSHPSALLFATCAQQYAANAKLVGNVQPDALQRVRDHNAEIRKEYIADSELQGQSSDLGVLRKANGSDLDDLLGHTTDYLHGHLDHLIFPIEDWQAFSTLGASSRLAPFDWLCITG